MIFERIIQEWPLAFFGIMNGLFMWAIWSLGRRFAAKEELLPIMDRVLQCEQKIEVVRHDLGFQPRQKDIEGLRLATSQLEVKIARMEGTLRKLDETAQRLNDYLLNSGNQS